MPLRIFIDGKPTAEFTDATVATDRMHLTPWNVGLARNKIEGGWVKARIGNLAAGPHPVIIRAEGRSEAYKTDAKLMGGAAERDAGITGRDRGMRAVQIDCFMISAE